MHNRRKEKREGGQYFLENRQKSLVYWQKKGKAFKY